MFTKTLFATLVFIVAYAQEEDDDCMALKDCEPINWIMKNMEMTEEMSNVVHVVMKCDDDDGVFCLNESADDFMDDAMNTTEGDQIMLNNGRFDPQVAKLCGNSSVNLLFMAEDVGIVSIKFSGLAFVDVEERFKIRTQDQVHLIRLEASENLNSNCCYEIFERTHFRGEKKQILKAGEKIRAEFHVQSLRKAFCDNN